MCECNVHNKYKPPIDSRQMLGKDTTVHQLAVDALGLGSLSPYCRSQCRTREQLLKHSQTRNLISHINSLLIGPILWGHSGLLCQALSLSSLLLLWTSMRRRCATVAACDSSNTWWMAMWRAATHSGEWAQHFSNASYSSKNYRNLFMHAEATASQSCDIFGMQCYIYVRLLVICCIISISANTF